MPPKTALIPFRRGPKRGPKNQKKLVRRFARAVVARAVARPAPRRQAPRRRRKNVWQRQNSNFTGHRATVSARIGPVSTAQTLVSGMMPRSYVSTTQGTRHPGFKGSHRGFKTIKFNVPFCKFGNSGSTTGNAPGNAPGGSALAMVGATSTSFTQGFLLGAPGIVGSAENVNNFTQLSDYLILSQQLAYEAQGYTRYRYKRVRFHFIPSTATTSSARSYWGAWLSDPGLITLIAAGSGGGQIGYGNIPSLPNVTLWPAWEKATVTADFDGDWKYAQLPFAQATTSTQLQTVLFDRQQYSGIIVGCCDYANASATQILDGIVWMEGECDLVDESADWTAPNAAQVTRLPRNVVPKTIDIDEHPDWVVSLWRGLLKSGVDPVKAAEECSKGAKNRREVVTRLTNVLQLAMGQKHVDAMFPGDLQATCMSFDRSENPQQNDSFAEGTFFGCPVWDVAANAHAGLVPDSAGPTIPNWSTNGTFPMIPSAAFNVDTADEVVTGVMPRCVTAAARHLDSLALNPTRTLSAAILNGSQNIPVARTTTNPGVPDIQWVDVSQRHLMKSGTTFAANRHRPVVNPQQVRAAADDSFPAAMAKIDFTTGTVTTGTAASSYLGIRTQPFMSADTSVLPPDVGTEEKEIELPTSRRWIDNFNLKSVLLQPKPKKLMARKAVTEGREAGDADVFTSSQVAPSSPVVEAPESPEEPKLAPSEASGEVVNRCTCLEDDGYPCPAAVHDTRP